MHRLTSWTLNAEHTGKVTEFHYDDLGNITQVLVNQVEQERND